MSERPAHPLKKEAPPGLLPRGFHDQAVVEIDPFTHTQQ
jgi:hypothetical protein